MKSRHEEGDVNDDEEHGHERTITEGDVRHELDRHNGDDPEAAADQRQEMTGTQGARARTARVRDAASEGGRQQSRPTPSTERSDRKETLGIR